MKEMWEQFICRTSKKTFNLNYGFLMAAPATDWTNT